MTPRQQRIAVETATGVVIVSIAFALAGLTWRIAGHAGTGAVMVPDAPVRAAADLTPIYAFAPFGKGSSEAASATTLALVLKGVVLARPAELSNALIAVGAEPVRAFKVGDAVAGAMIETIQRDRILLNVGGRIEYLTFPQSVPVAGTASTPPPPGTAPAPAQPAPVLAPPAGAPTTASMLDRLDATPVGNGYRIGAGAPPGLREGDVISSVNGTALGNPARDRELFAAAQASGAAQVEIVRGGKRVTLSLPAR